jgi:hypothetical protein
MVRESLAKQAGQHGLSAARHNIHQDVGWQIR